MKKQKAHLALAASVLCAVQMGYVQAAGQTGMFGTTVPAEYQTDINNELASYPGELRDSQAYDTSTIRVVRRDSEVKKITAEGLPTRVDADYMRYKGNTGDIDASGDVVVTQGTKELRAPRVTGNVNAQEYNTAGGPYKFLEDGGKSKNMSGDSLAYQAATQSIQSTNVTGFSDPYYFKANNVDFKNNVGHIDKGMVTTKHAMAWKHTPDYRIEGEDIVVYPNDKAVIKHPTFYIKNTKILSLPSYTASLRHDKEGKFSAFSLLPRPMYDSDNGIGLYANMAIPTGRNGEWYANYKLLSKVGFKPDIGYRRFLPWGEASFGYSKDDATFRDEKVWVEKIGELKVDTNAYHLGDTKLTIRGGASGGYWKEGDTKGMHYKYYGELSHDVLKPWANANFRFFGGYQRDFYKADGGVVRSMPYWGARLNQKVNNRLDLWAGYTQHNLGSTHSPYPFDEVEIPKELTYGGTVHLTNKDDVSLNIRQNAENGNIEYKNLTYHRDLHSFDAYLTYKAVQKTWEMKWTAKDF